MPESVSLVAFGVIAFLLSFSLARFIPFLILAAIYLLTDVATIEVFEQLINLLWVEDPHKQLAVVSGSIAGILWGFAMFIKEHFKE